LNEDAIPYYELLKNAGILYHTPEAASEKVNAVYPDVEGWWNEPELQFVVNKFCNRYARTSNNDINEWVTELKTLHRQGKDD